MEDKNTDRELLIKFEGKLALFNERIDVLADSINNFTKTLERMETGKLASLEKKIDDIERWRQRLAGAWVVILFSGGLITAGLLAFFKWLKQ